MSPPALPVKIGRYLALRLLGHAILLVAVLALMLLATATRLGDRGFWPSAWCLAGPALTAAALLTSWRLLRTGERAALDVAAPGPGLWLPILLAGVLWHLPFLLGGDGQLGSAPQPATTTRAWSGQSGELLLFGSGCRFSFSVDARLRAEPMATPELPPGFEPVPQNPRRHRRQLFLARGPLSADASPLDPSALRWLFVAWGLIAPALVLTARSWRWGCLALLPFPAVVALL